MDMILDSQTLLILATVAVAAGFIDTLAGGGGLITIPAMLLMQVPPVQAIATNKLQGTFGTLASTLTLMRRRQVTWDDIKAACLSSFMGASLGAAAIQFVDASVLDLLIPIVLVSIGLYFLLAPSAGTVERKPRMGSGLYRSCIVPLIGFYDGFFGPGTGSLFSLAEVALRGRNLVRATASAKGMNLASNMASLVVFIIGGKVLWILGGTMAIGQVIGAYLGSLVLMTGGSRLIRPLIVIVCFAMVGRYLYQHL
ncbi:MULTISPECIES: TSUP family transporter [Pseudomonas]|uniref:Probable membrane transporter protein n=2 Tax=Pseudomonadaceae TaxID=135621 RepID=A0A0D0K4A5_9PSED|nr:MULTISPECIES: TSUP family transporter [Pseudomonas]KIQ03274.1 membrane protein [Pseudomonas fulva]MCW2290787.1 putative membrane protein YfcA [Pseudomonas sp. BIGb0408]NYH74641.1 hypothetical protein [Pseudomonas flavescens]